MSDLYVFDANKWWRRRSDGGTVTPPPPPPAAGQTQLGINEGPLQSSAGQGLVNSLGLRLPAVRTYHQSQSEFAGAWTSTSTERKWFDSGYLPMLSISPRPATAGKTSHQSVADGDKDTEFIAFFRRAHQLPFGAAVDGNQVGAGYGGTKRQKVWFHYRHEPDNPSKYGEGSATSTESEAAATFCAAFEHLWDLRNSVEADPTYNPDGTRKVFMAPIYTPEKTRIWPAGGGTPWIPNPAKMDAFGTDPYWPSVGGWTDPANIKWIETGAQGALNYVVNQVTTRLRADMPIVLGEFRIARTAAVADGGKGLDPNINVETGAWSGQSIRRRWMLDPSLGMVQAFQKFRLPNGEPRFPVACWFYFQKTPPDKGTIDIAVDPVANRAFAESARTLGLTY